MLINCPECNSKISEYASFCPQCGCPKEMFVRLTAKRESPNSLINDLNMIDMNKANRKGKNKETVKKLEKDNFEKEKQEQLYKKVVEERLQKQKDEDEKKRRQEELVKKTVIKRGDDVEVVNTKNGNCFVLRKVTEYDGVIGLKIGNRYRHQNNVYKITNIRINAPYDGLKSLLPTDDHGGFLGRHSGARHVENDSNPWIIPSLKLL